MSRTLGLIPIAANFEPAIAEPFDGRGKVPTRAEILLTTTWQNAVGGVYTYVGLTTTVYNDGANNGLYILLAADYTQITNWLFIPPNVINDTATALDSTWSSTKLSDILDELESIAGAGLAL